MSPARPLKLALLALLLTAAPPALGASSPEDEAGQLIEEGLKDARAKRFAEAAEKFERAVKLHPRAVFFHNLARAHQELGNLALAHAYFGQALELDAGYRYADQATKSRASIEKKLQKTHALLTVSSVPSGAIVVVTPEGHAALPGLPTPFERWVPGGAVELAGSKLGFKPHQRAVVLTSGQPQALELVLEPLLKKGFLDVTSNIAIATRVFINGELVGKAPLNLTKPEGRYALRVEAAGYQPFEREVDVKGDERVAVLASMEVLREAYDPGDPGMRNLGIGLMATGGAALIAGGVMHGMHFVKGNEANDVPPGPQNQKKFDDLQSQADTFLIGALASYGGAAVLGGLGVYFFVANQASGNPPDSATWELRPVIEPARQQVGFEAVLTF